MKRLLVLRHAKSDWGDPALSDFDRTLNRRGERDAPCMGSWLAGQGLQPDAIISSPALRAATTARLVAEAAGCAVELLRFEPAIYDAFPATLLGLTRGFAASWQLPLLVGHNPGMHELVEILTDQRLDRFPTCALAVLELEIASWQQIAPGCARLEKLLTPKTLPAD